MHQNIEENEEEEEEEPPHKKQKVSLVLAGNIFYKTRKIEQHLEKICKFITNATLD